VWAKIKILHPQKHSISYGYVRLIFAGSSFNQMRGGGGQSKKQNLFYTGVSRAQKFIQRSFYFDNTQQKAQKYMERPVLSLWYC